jgi:cysteinyl-tRNA synthetase
MLTLYNTRTRQKDHFRPRHGKKVSLYTCGPTVYNYAHIGNLRTYVFEDVLRRVLKYDGYEVIHVMNITDVGHLTDDADDGEDKMEKGAKREGKTAWEIAEFYTDAFKTDMRDLNLLVPHIWCKATDHIDEQIAEVQILINKGYTYETSDGIYFDTTKLTDYGKLAQLDKQVLKAGKRIDIGQKENPHDFALWKFTKEGESRQMEWDAFGHKGFPGWHIECSAMSIKYLGDQIDIHCGGIDHIPVHHTNELAQAEASGAPEPWVNFWLHGEFLNITDPSTDAQGRMAKSEDNFITLKTLRDKGYCPLAYRYLLLQAHYRKQLTFSWEALEGAKQGLNRLRQRVLAIDETLPGDPKIAHDFGEAINEDLNTSQALAIIATGLKDNGVTREMVIAFDKVLGLNLHEHDVHETVDIPSEIQDLLDKRELARDAKDWTESDRLRDEMLSHGFEIDDTKTGQHIYKQ